MGRGGFFENTFKVDRALNFAKFTSSEDMSVVDALSNKKILERTGLKYLDTQVSLLPVDFWPTSGELPVKINAIFKLSTGGLIFPTKPFRLTLKQAHQMQLIPAKIASKCKGNYFQDVNNDQKRVNYRFSFTIWSFAVRSKVERK